MKVSSVRAELLAILIMLSHKSVLLEHAVQVPEPPWPMPHLFVPPSSTVQINCTTNNDSPLWSIDLANDSVTTQLQFDRRRVQLNDHGAYELPQN